MPAEPGPAGAGRPVDPRLFRHAPAVRAGVAAAVALGAVSTALVVGQATMLATVLAGSFAGDGVGALAGALGGLAAVLAGRAAVGWLGEAVAGRVAIDAKRQLRSRLLGRTLRLGPDWLARHGTGEVTTLATRGLDALDGYLARYLPQLVLAALVPTAVVAILAGTDWPSALAVLLTLPLIPVFMVLVGQHTQARTERQWDLLQRLGGHFLDVVEGLPTLTVFRRARAQVQTIRRVTDAHRRAAIGTLRVAFLSALVLELLATLATAVVAVEIGLRLLSGGVPYRTALLVLLLAPEAYLPLRRLGLEYHSGREGAAAAGRALDIVAETTVDSSTAVESVVDRSVPAGLPATGELRLAGVTVRYPDRSGPVLSGVSLAVPAGERVALVGPSGAGKSSLLAVLLRFAPPAAGRVTFGGLDVLVLPPEQWRRRIAWVPQHPYLLPGSVAENVRLGCPAASPAELDRVAGLVGLDAVLDRLPAGWDTPVGERGLRLSSGQRQRVALARALLRDAPLLLLDEPTAHLDAESAAAVRGAVLAAAAGRTLLVVTHQAGWLPLVDRVVVVRAGRLVPGGPVPVLPPATRRPAAAPCPLAVTE